MGGWDRSRAEMSVDLTIKTLRDSLMKPVIVRVKGSRTIRGILTGFDEHLNLVLKKAEFIDKEGNAMDLGDVVLRGDNVILISPP
ncbi:MAG: LSM domain-containing protein [Candidatus Geothermarchaeales archaeon]